MENIAPPSPEVQSMKIQSLIEVKAPFLKEIAPPFLLDLQFIKLQFTISDLVRPNQLEMDPPSPSALSFLKILLINRLYSEFPNSDLFYNNTFKNNIADEGGAIETSVAKNNTIKNNIFENNYATTNGGSIEFGNSEFNLLINNIFKNESAEGDGG